MSELVTGTLWFLAKFLLGVAVGFAIGKHMGPPPPPNARAQA